MSDDPKETSLASARAMFSREPEPPPEPIKSDDAARVYEYAPEAFSADDWEGYIIVVENGKLNPRAVEEVRALFEADRIARELDDEDDDDAGVILSAEPITLPGEVSMRFVQIKKPEPEPDFAPREGVDPMTLMQALVERRAALRVEAVPGVILVEQLQQEQDIYRREIICAIDGVVVHETGLPVVDVTAMPVHIERREISMNSGMHVADDGAMRVKLHIRFNPDRLFNEPAPPRSPRKLDLGAARLKVGGLPPVSFSSMGEPEPMEGGRRDDRADSLSLAARALKSDILSFDVEQQAFQMEYGGPMHSPSSGEGFLASAQKELSRHVAAELEKLVETGEIAAVGQVRFEHHPEEGRLIAVVDVAVNPRGPELELTVPDGLTPEYEPVAPKLTPELRQRVTDALIADPATRKVIASREGSARMPSRVSGSLRKKLEEVASAAGVSVEEAKAAFDKMTADSARKRSGGATTSEQVEALMAAVNDGTMTSDEAIAELPVTLAPEVRARFATAARSIARHSGHEDPHPAFGQVWRAPDGTIVTVKDAPNKAGTSYRNTVEVVERGGEQYSTPIDEFKRHYKFVRNGLTWEG